jgi:hypothetical protein
MVDSPLHGISALSKANAGWEGLRGQMIRRAMPAVALATGRATLAGQVEGDGPLSSRLEVGREDNNLTP